MKAACTHTVTECLLCAKMQVVGSGEGSRKPTPILHSSQEKASSTMITFPRERK